MLPSPRRSMLGIILLLSVRPVLGGVQTPSGAMPVTANVMVSTECRYGSDLNGSRAEAAGILIGRVADSVFAVTALHVVRPSDPTCSAREVVLVLREPFAYFRVDVVRQSERDDLALLRGAPDSLDALLRGRHWNRRGPEPRGTVFLLGCPVGGSCWDDPLEGRIRSQSVLRDSSVWRIQSPFLEDGYSGGPVVSRSGEVVGLTLSFDGQNAHAVRWYRVEEWLRAGGYKVTLPTRDLTPVGWLSPTQSGKRRPSLGILGGVLPMPARNVDGERLMPNVAVRFEGGGTENQSVYLGFEHLSFSAADLCSACTDRRELRGTAGFFAGLGFTSSRRL